MCKGIITKTNDLKASESHHHNKSSEHFKSLERYCENERSESHSDDRRPESNNHDESFKIHHDNESPESALLPLIFLKWQGQSKQNDTMAVTIRKGRC
jgi:hypothetical protein